MIVPGFDEEEMWLVHTFGSEPQFFSGYVGQEEPPSTPVRPVGFRFMRRECPSGWTRCIKVT